MTTIANRPGWSTIHLAGHACEIHEPSGTSGHAAAILLEDLPGKPRVAAEALRGRLEAAGIPVICPDPAGGWWLDRVVSAFDPVVPPMAYVCGPVLDEVARRFGVKPTGVGLLGCGAGGQGALGIAYRRPETFPVVAAVTPAIDFHHAMRDGLEGSEPLWEVYAEVERARQDTAILHVHPLNWPRHQFFAADIREAVWYDGASRLHGKLAALGVPHEWMLEPVTDGSFAVKAAEAAVSFVVDRLARESRRIA